VWGKLVSPPVGGGVLTKIALDTTVSHPQRTGTAISVSRSALEFDGHT
jgi:hypothetical protein